MPLRTQLLPGARPSTVHPGSSLLKTSLDAASGYTALDMYVDAWNELENLPADLRGTETVLAAKIEILQHFGKWKFARQLAESLTRHFPANPRWWLAWSMSMRGEDSIQSARSILEEAVDVHPSVALIHYNLACYACLLGEMERSRGFLQQAFLLDDTLKIVALCDPDLRPFGKHIGSIGR